MCYNNATNLLGKKHRLPVKPKHILVGQAMRQPVQQKKYNLQTIFNILEYVLWLEIAWKVALKV
jgi:hypothetical protein